MPTNKVVGFRVKSDQQFVHTDFTTTWRSYAEPTPISQADAFRRAAAFIENHPGLHPSAAPTVVPVYHTPTPLENTAAELGALLTSLCARHGMSLGLTQDQIEAQIAQELTVFGAVQKLERITVCPWDCERSQGPVVGLDHDLQAQ